MVRSCSTVGATMVGFSALHTHTHTHTRSHTAQFMQGTSEIVLCIHHARLFCINSTRDCTVQTLRGLVYRQHVFGRSDEYMYSMFRQYTPGAEKREPSLRLNITVIGRPNCIFFSVNIDTIEMQLSTKNQQDRTKIVCLGLVIKK